MSSPHAGEYRVTGERYGMQVAASNAAPRFDPAVIRTDSRIGVLRNFWRLVDVRGADECWPWTHRFSPDGYGRLGFLGESVDAHRMAWELSFGAIPEGQCVLHSCDNPPCCNPAHLSLGTQYENMVDMLKKGRHSKIAYRRVDGRCFRGHLITGSNGFKGGLNPRGEIKWSCVLCRRARVAARKAGVDIWDMLEGKYAQQHAALSAGIAQSVEHDASNVGVASSSLAACSTPRAGDGQ